MISVSIILTTYNSGDQLLEVINSITNQNGIGIDFSIELIVIDDCSSDNTVEILKKNNIQFLSTNNMIGCLLILIAVISSQISPSTKS